MSLERTTKSLTWTAFSLLECQGFVRTEQFLDEVRIKFVALDFTVDKRDATYVRLCWYEAVKELWICYLHVASSFRGLGLGRGLVAASEQLAWRLDARSIHLFPLQPARGFWLRLGFEPHANISRVLMKSQTTQKERR